MGDVQALSQVEIVNLDPDLAPALEQIELTCFPTANPDDLLSEADIRAYAETFPEGYFVALVDGKPVGMSAGIYLDFDFENAGHTLAQITGENQCGNHDPNGEWYYGTDITVLPAYRRRGIGRRLYAERKRLVIEDNERGIIAVNHGGTDLRPACIANREPLVRSLPSLPGPGLALGHSVEDLHHDPVGQIGGLLTGPVVWR